MTHPLSTFTGTASLLFVLALGPSAAQKLDSSSYVAPGVRPHTQNARPLSTDPTDECALYLARSETSLVLTFAGQRAFDAVTVEAGDQTCNGRAEDLLIDAFAGNYERLAYSLPAHRREAGTRDFSRFLAVLTGRRGPV